MSLAETYSAATASMAVSPCTTCTSCIGPQLVGVIVPEKLPCPAAVADPPIIRTAAPATAAKTKSVRRGRSFTWPPPVARTFELTAHIYRDIASFKHKLRGDCGQKLTDESINDQGASHNHASRRGAERKTGRRARRCLARTGATCRPSSRPRARAAQWSSRRDLFAIRQGRGLR